MPKGRRSNERRRNRRIAGRKGRDEMDYVEGLARGRYKLEALFERALKVQHRRRKATR